MAWIMGFILNFNHAALMQSTKRLLEIDAEHAKTKAENLLLKKENEQQSQELRKMSGNSFLFDDRVKSGEVELRRSKTLWQVIVFYFFIIIYYTLLFLFLLSFLLLLFLLLLLLFIIFIIIFFFFNIIFYSLLFLFLLLFSY
jgi:Flp pilus assembly protein TadB